MVLENQSQNASNIYLALLEHVLTKLVGAQAAHVLLNLSFLAGFNYFLDDAILCP